MRVFTDVCAFTLFVSTLLASPVWYTPAAAKEAK